MSLNMDFPSVSPSLAKYLLGEISKEFEEVLIFHRAHDIVKSLVWKGIETKAWTLQTTI